MSRHKAGCLGATPHCDCEGPSLAEQIAAMKAGSEEAEGPAPAKALPETSGNLFRCPECSIEIWVKGDRYPENGKPETLCGCGSKWRLVEVNCPPPLRPVSESPVLSLASQRERVEKVLADHRAVTGVEIGTMLCTCTSGHEVFDDLEAWEVHLTEAIVSALHEEKS